MGELHSGRIRFIGGKHPKNNWNRKMGGNSNNLLHLINRIDFPRKKTIELWVIAQKQNFRRPPVINMAGFELRLDGVVRKHLCKLHMLSKILLHLSKHFGGVRDRSAGAFGANARCLRATSRVYFWHLTIKTRQRVEGNFMVGISHRGK